MIRLEFDEGKHKYYLDGTELPSVSAIIRPLSQSVYDTVDDSILAIAANRGTEIHKAIENFNIFGVGVIDPEYEGYFNAYKKWEAKRKPAVKLVEERTYNKMLMYAGTVDLLCEIDGRTCLVDYKSSYTVQDKVYRCQLEVYRQALSTHGIEIDRKIVLHLKKTEEYEEIVYPTYDAEAWKVFGACKLVYDYMSKK